MAPVEKPPLTDAARARVDNFVDAAFAFAVTLLVIGDGVPPRDVDALKAAMLQAPGFAAGFALIAMFWWSHRSYARVRPEGAAPLLLSLAIVFVVLVYVYPLRLFADVLVSAMTGSLQAGRGPVGSLADMRDLYLVYGAGFTTLAILYLAAFLHAATHAADPGRRRYGADGAGVWAILALAGVTSVALALLLPFDRGGWLIGLPGMVYALIPVGIGLLEAARAAVRR